MRRVKKIVLWSLGLFLLAVALIVVFLVTAGDGFYRWAAQKLLEDAIDRTIHVDGTFSFDVGLEPTLAVTDVWIENTPWAEKKEMVRIERVEIQIGLKPLFSGNVLVPRLVVEGLTLSLEKSPNGEGNWEVAQASSDVGDAAGQKDLFVPLLDFISLKDVAITYRDRQSGLDTEILLKSLQQRRHVQDASLDIQGEGSINQTDFRIKGRFGSIEQALTAAVPYPLKLTLEAEGLAVDLTGTVKHLPRAEGFDINLKARTPSIAQLLKTWQSDVTLAGRAKASVRLTGHLESLSAEDLVVEVLESSGQKLRAEGSLSNLWSGKGLDVRFTGELGPESVRWLHDPPHELRDFLNGIARLDIVGRITGSLEAPAFEKLHVRLEHSSGGDLSLQGHVALDLLGKSASLTGLGVTSILSLPGPGLLEQTLGTQLPDLGAIHATSELSWSNGWIVLRSLNVGAKSLEGLQIKAKGRIGRLSGKGLGFQLDPHLDLSANMDKSRPLISLVDKSLPELGPLMASARLSGTEGAYLFEGARLTLGTKELFWVEASGTLGALRLEQKEPLEGIALAVGFSLPSSKAIPQLFPPTVPELKKITGRFNVRGSPGALSISQARIEAEGPDGLVGTATGRVAKLSLLPGLATRDLVFELEARSPSTESVSRLIGFRLPELGPVRARAFLNDRGDLFTLTGIDISAGAPDKPAVRMTGEIGDLIRMNHVELSGNFETDTASLLGSHAPTKKSALGKVRGQFALSDADGSIGIEKLSAEVKETNLLSLSINGLFDDIKQRDDLRFEASLKVPSVAALGRELGFEASRLGAFSYKGLVSGSEERFRSEGKARLGQTDFSGSLSGSLMGKRPAVKAKLYSPVFHFADFGLVPEPGPPEGAAMKKGQEKEPGNKRLFGEDPIPFEVLKDFDLDLDVLLDELEGVDLNIDKAVALLKVKDGILKVDPLRFNFVGGNMEIHLVADTRPKAPKVRLKLEAHNVDLGDFLAQVDVDIPLDGELDMDLDLKAAGLSPRALASSLEGDWNLALARGQIRSSLLDLAAVDFGSWLFSDSARKGYSDLNCLVARFDFHDGVGKSDKMLLDTPNVLSTGEGVINFRDETIDIKADPHPKKKRFVEMTTPFSIEGPLASPSVEVNTTGSTVRTVHSWDRCGAW
jgi:uncharacterized protein involved in outer membrane biogenesis